jgi:hypothetical protein
MARGQAAGTSLTGSLNASTHVLVEKRGEKTPGGLLNVTTVTRTPVAWTETFTVPTRGGNTAITLFRNQTDAQVDTLIAGLDSTASNSVSSGRNEYGLYDGTIQSFVPADDGTWTWDRQNLTYVRSEGGTDTTTQERWYWEDTYTYHVRSGVGVSAGYNFFKGGHGSGTLEPNVARDTYFFLRVTKIERQYYKVGSVSSGVWSPGAKSAQGSAVTLFQAAATPWGTS